MGINCNNVAGVRIKRIQLFASSLSASAWACSLYRDLYFFINGCYANNCLHRIMQRKTVFATLIESTKMCTNITISIRPKNNIHSIDTSFGVCGMGFNYYYYCHEQTLIASVAACLHRLLLSKYHMHHPPNLKSPH